MALNIKNPEAERLARELARRRRAKITDVVIAALDAELKRDKARARADDQSEFTRKLRAIQDAIAAAPTLDERSTEEILGYDEHGLPS